MFFLTNAMSKLCNRKRNFYNARSQNHRLVLHFTTHDRNLNTLMSKSIIALKLGM